MIVLAVMSSFVTLLHNVSAVDVEITSITPSIGKVGDIVRIVGTINKTDGMYRIWFANIIVNEATAVGNVVNATFHVPAVPKGNHTITLEDIENNRNDTKMFSVEPAYYVKAIVTLDPPMQLQENSNVTIQVNVTGGAPDTIYYANITVKPPNPRNETYLRIVTLSNTTDTGSGYATLVYPNDFNGMPNTNYVGTYTVAFNKTATDALATDTFTIGLTNATEYHRRQFVGIKAAGYYSNESVTIKITSEGETIYSIINVNATEEGLVLANWTVPENASIGIYTVNITSTWLPPNATIKIPPDIQNFTVPGFDINVTTKNLAGDIVQGATVKVFENGNLVVNKTSNSNGLVTMTLEIGNYTFQAFYKGEKVYEDILPITSAAPHILDCNLTNLKISVYAIKDGIEIGVREAKIYLTRENKTLTTNINGTVITRSLLPNVNYTLNASRYGVSFNVTNLSTLLVNGNAVAWYNLTFICPTKSLQVNVTNVNGEPINNARIKVQELMGGLLYENNTTINGIAIFNCAFGKYVITVYDVEGIKLNETTVSMFEDLNVTLRCKLWGLTVSIKVVDYFGQPISNVKIMLQREGSAPRSKYTQLDGIATFDSITGGNLQINLYLFDQTQPYIAQYLFVDSSTTIGIKLGAYVMLAGFFVETSHLITAIIIVVSVIMVLLIEVYRRRHFKPQSSLS